MINQMAGHLSPNKVEASIRDLLSRPMNGHVPFTDKSVPYFENFFKSRLPVSPFVLLVIGIRRGLVFCTSQNLVR